MSDRETRGERPVSRTGTGRSRRRSGESVAEIVEITDPGCPWCWAAEPTMRWLHRRYGSHVRWRRVLGVPEPAGGDREDDRATAVAQARRLLAARHGEVPLGGTLARAPGSSRLPALAVKAAELQGGRVAELVLRRLREVSFLDGRPAESAADVAEALAGLPSVDLVALLGELAGDGRVDAALDADQRVLRAPRPSVFGLTAPAPHPGAAVAESHGARYAFPTVIVTGARGRRIVPGLRAPQAYRDALVQAEPALRTVAEPAPLDPDRALIRHGSLGPADLRLLCAGARPRTVAPRATATTPVWLSAERTAAPWLSSVLGDRFPVGLTASATGL